jgi:hypothetical protein
MSIKKPPSDQPDPKAVLLAELYQLILSWEIKDENPTSDQKAPTLDAG